MNIIENLPHKIKIIFLDIDGVLNSILHYELRKMKEPTNKEFFDIGLEKAESLSQENVDLLRLLIEKTNTKIVISSTWRKDINLVAPGTTIEEKIKLFQELFEKKGWENAPIIGFTPSLYTIRGHEVAESLDEISKSSIVEDYIILDDDSDFILGALEELSEYQLDKMGIRSKEEIAQKSDFFSYQKLLVTNKLTGLSFKDVVEVLKLWNPHDSLVKCYDDYLPYFPKYGKKF